MLLAGRTGLFFLVSFDTDKTLARISYISDGFEISDQEYSAWRTKLDKQKVLMTRPAKKGLDGNLAKILKFLTEVE